MKFKNHESIRDHFHACEDLINQIEKSIENYVSSGQSFIPAANRFEDINFDHMRSEIKDYDEIIDSMDFLVEQIIKAKKEAINENTKRLTRQRKAGVEL